MGNAEGAFEEQIDQSIAQVQARANGDPIRPGTTLNFFF